ncbi:MAG: AbrB/MazE/SpoVT family DNA-binding domain-containing protein [Desulfobacterales bacterium]|uniref:AbrB/MazE/SpoVT family DNA-binding domain-containing protein n=1 Tax=Candidatus Desulfatibia profunda TaxID=2841695 RepID=A0A8J6NQ83_9BACT|nr:AbrB/MazE/SpoVT family DNA-binding domain-containing protein [Candidatus Desulfatibia profunda]MBL7180771.1 AbrB/MazE/SpoVT family DNA-binding domain-containing protein [Desulfobacterales bacterium]
MNTVKVLTKGQIVIPASIRKKYNIQPGNALKVFEYGNLIYLVPPSNNPEKDAKGCLPGQPSLSEALLQDRKKDFAE